MLLELSTQYYAPEKIREATNLLRGMLLVRMTGENGYITANELEWRSEIDYEGEEDEFCRQGAALNKSKLFFSDMLVHILEDDIIKNRIQEIFSDIDENAYLALQYFILTTNIEYTSLQDSVKAENLDDVDITKWAAKYLRWFDTWRAEGET